MPEASRPDVRRLILWLDATVAAVAMTVVIGGITRLTESGLSITEWKPIAGILPPLTATDWATAYAKFLQIPQAQSIHLGITLGEFKGIFWWEWAHRLIARVVGLVITLPFVWFWLRGQIPQGLKLRFASLPLLVLAQGALGWYMVSSGLSVRVNVSQYRLVAHLGLALVILVVALWTSASLRAAMRGAATGKASGAASHVASAATSVAERTAGAFDIRRWAIVADVFAVWTFLVILSGGFVAGLRAGKIYNTIPLMDGKLVPPGYGYLDGFFTNAFENPAAAQFHHRVLAITTVLLAFGFWFWALRAHAPARIVRAQRNVALIASLQVALGIATLLLVVPIALAALHQLTAVALLSATVLAAHAARSSS